MLYTKEQVREAKKIAKTYGVTKLGGTNLNTKLKKSDKGGKWLTYGIHLAPHKQGDGKHNLCPGASAGCSAACLYTSGYGRYSMVQEARIRKSKFYIGNREAFKIMLWNELKNHVARCAKKGVKPAARLNLTSDIVWEVVFPQLFTEFKSIKFYDYTKLAKRLEKKLPKNYHLTFSRSEANDDQVSRLMIVDPKINIAVVFDKMPKKWMGRKVIDATKHDLRFLDRKGVICGLEALGDGKKDMSGFVVKSTSTPLPVLQG